jgi:outer membrane protein assembly factor BamB
MKKILRLLSIISICFVSTLSLACDPLTSPRDQFLWKQSLSDGKYIEGELPNIFHNNTVIALGVKNNKWTLYAFDAGTGETRWQWSDWFNGDKPLMDYVYTFDNSLILSNTGFNYAIDTRTGKTIFRTAGQPSRESGTQGASGIGQLYFFGSFISYNENYLMRGNINRNEEQVLVTMPRATSAVHSTPFIAQNGDTMLVYFSTYGEPATNFRNRTYINLYNVSKRQEIYTLLQDTSSPENANVLTGGVPLVRNKNIYSAIGRSVQANDLETGRLLWKTKTEQSFTVSGIVEGDGIIFGNSADGFMHAFDTQTGKLLWKVETYGTARKPFYMNGVLYVVSPGGGHLYAFDGKAGTILWKFTVPANEGGSFTAFNGMVTGANGKIYVHSFYNLYCYKAAR